MGSSDHFTDSDLWVSFKMNERLEKPEDSKSELINYLSGSYCISHAMNERLKNLKARNRWTNSSTEPLGWCACMTERITPRNDSFFSSLIKDSFKMNESFKTDPSLATSARATKESGSYLCASNVTPTAVRFIVSVFLCLLCSCRMYSTQMTCSHFRKNRPKKRQKPAGCRSRIISKNRPVPIFGRSTGASLVSYIMSAQTLLKYYSGCTHLSYLFFHPKVSITGSAHRTNTLLSISPAIPCRMSSFRHL